MGHGTLAHGHFGQSNDCRNLGTTLLDSGATGKRRQVSALFYVKLPHVCHPE